MKSVLLIAVVGSLLSACAENERSDFSFVEWAVYVVSEEETAGYSRLEQEDSRVVFVSGDPLLSNRDIYDCGTVEGGITGEERKTGISIYLREEAVERLEDAWSRNQSQALLLAIFLEGELLRVSNMNTPKISSVYFEVDENEESVWSWLPGLMADE